MATEPRRGWRRRLLVALTSVAGVVIVLVGLVGFAHTKAGRPLLALLGHAKGACPLGYDKKASVEDRERARLRFATAHPAEALANERPALGFALDHTSRAEVLAWARDHGVDCVEPSRGHDVECANVPEGLLPSQFGGVALQNLWLDFGRGDVLVALIAVRRDRSPDAISATFRSVTRAVALEAGPAAVATGEGTAGYLEEGALYQASTEYRFRDYYALMRATNMGNGFVLTEEYRSLPN